MPANRLKDLSALKINGLPESWRTVLHRPEITRQLALIERNLTDRLLEGRVVFPHDPWRALRMTPLESIKVVILGQDPYHGPDQAQGLAFSVDRHCPTPPSLRNIFKELDRSQEHMLSAPRSNDLSDWARQGVLLLNTVLTVEQGSAGSHARLGWQSITDHLIAAAASEPRPIVFLLWGKHAQDKRAIIEQLPPGDHPWPRLILESNHPSPLSASRGPTPFIGCEHFIICNQWLAEQGVATVQW